MISVIMPCHNRQAYLAEAINSILKQSYKDWELIIVDDGSTDDSRKVLDYYSKKDKRINVYYSKHSGIASTRNKGIRQAEGEYIAVMDSDDVAHPDRLKISLKKIKDADFVYSSYAVGDELLNVSHYISPPPEVTFKSVKENGAWPHVTIMAKRECFEENPYREDFKVNDDAWLVWQWFKAGYKGVFIEQPLMIVRYHSESVSNKKKKEIEKTQDILNWEYEQWER